MLTKLFLPAVPGVRVDRVWRDGSTIHLEVATTRRWAQCPVCHRRSRRLHNHYDRTIADLPCGGAGLVIHLHTRRFVCRMRWCRRTIFCERLPDLVAASARRTIRLHDQVLRTGFDLGGDPGARHLTAEGTPISPRTLLRLVRAAPPPAAGPVRVLGIDDWAKRKGRSYGTILVNLETHAVIDVLPDRTAETVATWLLEHPEVEVVSRDRGGAYAEAARQGAPQAVQIADRFHLLKNMADTVERVLSRERRVLREAADAVLAQEYERTVGSVMPAAADVPLVPPAPCVPSHPPVPLTRGTSRQEILQAERQARQEEIMALHRQGITVSEIARRLHLTRPTVRKLVRAEDCPEPAVRAHILSPYEPYLWQRWTQGCRNAFVLWQEIRAQGFRGSYPHVRHAVRGWRTEPAPRGRAAQAGSAPPPIPAPHVRRFSARQTTWLLLRPADDLKPDEHAFVAQLLALSPDARVLQARAQEFFTLMRARDHAAFEPWLQAVDGSDCPELHGFAEGLRRDRAAVEAALQMAWSNGQVEGQVNKLKDVS